jgi:Fur family transcriptional regulator, ferric uptake regulator
VNKLKIDIKVYEDVLKDRGYKITHQRKIILETMSKNNDKHLSCDEIFGIISKENPEIGIATVYRTLLLFEKLNIVYKLNFDDGCSRYELDSGTEDHQHHHLICLKCGKVIEVQLDLLESLESEIQKDKNFTIVDHNVKFYGYCSDCKENL